MGMRGGLVQLFYLGTRYFLRLPGLFYFRLYDPVPDL
jgi:hypothetical protein